MPANTVKVDGTTPWGNPYQAGKDGDGNPHMLVTLFRKYLGWSPEKRRDLTNALRGKNLACWCRLCEVHTHGKPFDVDCPDCAPCHADVLGEIANQEPAR